MSKYRFLIVDTSGDVTGTDDADSLPSIDEDEFVCTIIDTESGTFSNENIADEGITEYEGPEESEDE